MLTERQRAIIIISRADGIGKVKAKRIFSVLDNKPEKIFDGMALVRGKLMTVLSEKDYAELCVSLQSGTDREEKIMEEKRISFLTFLDEKYPDSLKAYDDAPIVLYYKGNIDLIDTEIFAVVGTRYPTKYGVRVTEEFVGNLSTRFTIVSGMARGVDSIAHRACLDNFGKTIAVLGCGVDVVYPPENKGLYDEIVERGLVISE